MVEVLDQILSLMRRYPGVRLEQFGEHPLHDLVRAMRVSLSNVKEIRARPFLKVKVSVGQGSWAVIPWIAMLDSRETSTTKNGVYVIILFRADMSGVYVTLNQGITIPTERLGRAAARAALTERANVIRTRFPELTTLGFDLAQNFDLKTAHASGAAYKESTIASRLLTQTDLVEGVSFEPSVAHALGIYEKYLAKPVRIMP